MELDSAQIVQQLLKSKGLTRPDDFAKRLLSTVRALPRPVQTETP